MSLEQKIMEQLKEAMKAKNEAALRSLRAIKAAILIAKTAEAGINTLSADEEIKLLQKLVKQRRDALEIYQQQQRTDLAQKEQEEIDIIEKFLPAQLSEAALAEAVAAIITTTGASSPADMGKVMGVATRELAGKADGKAISAVVKNLLSKA
jgi:uncharacterized protein YqeY